MERCDLTPEQQLEICRVLLGELSAGEAQLLVSDSDVADRAGRAVLRAVREKSAEQVAKVQPKKSGGSNFDFGNMGSYFW